MTDPHATEQCYIVSLKHTAIHDFYITVWRPDDRGYASPLPWAGRYTVEAILAAPNYYNNGRETIAVPCSTLDTRGVNPRPGTVDNDTGPVVLNTRENWDAILSAVIAPPAYKPRPAYPGAKRRRSA